MANVTQNKIATRRAAALCAEVEADIGSNRVPGSDLRVIVDNALKDDPEATAADVIEIIRAAEDEARQ